MTALLVEPPYPYQSLLGFTMTDWSQDFCRAELPMGDHLGNRFGLLHGGVYASLLDTVMGFCGCYTGSHDDRRLAMTLSLNVNFLSRPKGRMLIGEGRRTGGGRKTFFAEGQVTDETGEKIATASGVFRYTSGGG